MNQQKLISIVILMELQLIGYQEWWHTGYLIAICLIRPIPLYSDSVVGSYFWFIFGVITGSYSFLNFIAYVISYLLVWNKRTKRYYTPITFAVVIWCLA